MAVPKFLIALPLIVAGIFIPGLTSSTKLPDSPDIVGMVQTDFATPTVTIHVGGRLDIDNNSNFLHTLSPGTNGLIRPQPGMPLIGTRKLQLVMMPRGKIYMTGQWDRPGVYYLTCTLHAGMNLTVVVIGKGQSAA